MKKVTSFQKLNIALLRLVFYQCAKCQIVCQLGQEIIQLQSSTLIRGLLLKYFDKNTKHLGCDSLKKVTANQKTTGNIANIQENVYT